MNRLFHKHGRIAFTLLTLVIIVPFVLYFSAAPSELFTIFTLGAKKSNISMYGKNISQNELDHSVFATMITFALQGNQFNFETLKNNPMVLEQTLTRIRLLKEAKNLGIMVNDSEIIAYIKTIPVFQANGNFSPILYKIFINYQLGKEHITENDLIVTIKENIKINLLAKLITDPVIVSENSVKQFYNTLNQKYIVKVAEFTGADYINSINTTNQEIQNYFEINRKKYNIPAKFKADIIRFNFISYKSEAEKSITPKLINDYYLKNKSQYKGINRKKAKEKIKAELVQQQEEKITQNKAQSFAVNVYKQIESSEQKTAAPIIFNQYAQQNKYTVHKITDWITAETTQVERVGNISELTPEIAKLYTDQAISNAIRGKNAYYVACLTTRQNARLAEFIEVKKQVEDDYKYEKSVTLAKEIAKKTVAKLNAELQNNKTMTLTKKFKDIPEFSQEDNDLLGKVNNSDLVIEATLQTSPEHISNAVETKNGSLIVYVEKVIPPPEQNFLKLKNNILGQYKAYKQQMAWNNYATKLKNDSKTIIYNSK